LFFQGCFPWPTHSSLSEWILMRYVDHYFLHCTIILKHLFTLAFQHNLYPSYHS
jgi:hypothetical protein